MGGELCGLRANGGARMLVTMQQQSSPGCGVLLPRCCRSAELTATERQRKKKNMRAWGARGEKVMDAALSRPHPIPTQLHQQEERKKNGSCAIL